MYTYISTHLPEIQSALSRHALLFVISMTIATIIGIALSIFITGEGRERVGRIILTVTGAAQSTPSIAVVALAFIFVGIGIAPAIIALVIYSLVPIVFNTTSGIIGVSPMIIEAARGMGLTRGQILWKVKMPLSMPVIMSGIRSAATINIGTVTVAAVIGGGGLGDLILTGLKMQRTEIIVVGAGLAGILAIVVDTIFALLERRVIPGGMTIDR